MQSGYRHERAASLTIPFSPVRPLRKSASFTARPKKPSVTFGTKNLEYLTEEWDEMVDAVSARTSHLVFDITDLPEADTSTNEAEPTKTPVMNDATTVCKAIDIYVTDAYNVYNRPDREDTLQPIASNHSTNLQAQNDTSNVSYRLLKSVNAFKEIMKPSVTPVNVQYDAFSNISMWPGTTDVFKQSSHIPSLGSCS
jgi:hypothetical protein